MAFFLRPGVLGHIGMWYPCEARFQCCRWKNYLKRFFSSEETLPFWMFFWQKFCHSGVIMRKFWIFFLNFFLNFLTEISSVAPVAWSDLAPAAARRWRQTEKELGKADKARLPKTKFWEFQKKKKSIFLRKFWYKSRILNRFRSINCIFYFFFMNFCVNLPDKLPAGW